MSLSCVAPRKLGIGLAISAAVLFFILPRSSWADAPAQFAPAPGQASWEKKFIVSRAFAENRFPDVFFLDHGTIAVSLDSGFPFPLGGSLAIGLADLLALNVGGFSIGNFDNGGLSADVRLAAVKLKWFSTGLRCAMKFITSPDSVWTSGGMVDFRRYEVRYSMTFPFLFRNAVFEGGVAPGLHILYRGNRPSVSSSDLFKFFMMSCILILHFPRKRWDISISFILDFVILSEPNGGVNFAVHYDAF